MSPVPTTLYADRPGYPTRLGKVPDRPAELRMLGEFPERSLAVAIVGARAASGHAAAAARSLAAELASGGALIVSGGAVGVDAAAHRGALDVGGATAAVLGTGIDVFYPARNRPLFAEMLDAGGALLSPYEDGARPLPGRFVRRNAVIAGLADAVVVVGAGSGSGSLHTAAAAQRYGRVVGALPGTLGCEALIAQGAAVVESLRDLQEALAGAPRRPDVTLPASDSEAARVLGALDDAPRDEDHLVGATGLDQRAVSRALTGLELEGLCVLLPGRNYVRSSLASELMVR